MPSPILNISDITPDQPGCVWVEKDIIIDVTPSAVVRIEVAMPVTVAIAAFCLLNLCPSLMKSLRKWNEDRRRRRREEERRRRRERQGQDEATEQKEE
jgi:hypothetical protein